MFSMPHDQSSLAGTNPPKSEMPTQSSDNVSRQTLPSLALKDFFLWIIGRRRRFQVNGSSMLPILKSGDVVLVNSHAYKLPDITPIPGELVIVRHPTQSELLMVKRIVSIVSNPSQLTVPEKPDTTFDIDATISAESNKQKSADLPQSPPLYYWIEGDNPSASTDSRSFGPVSHSCILGKVTTRFS